MKNNNFIYICSALLMNILFFTCCSKEPAITEISVVDGNINYFSKSMDFPSEGGSRTLNFVSNVKWTLSFSETQNSVSWCSLSQSEGRAGTYNITISVEENKGNDDRNVVLVLSAGGIQKNIIVNQKQKDAITLTTNRFEVGNEGGTIDVKLNTNTDFTYEIVENCKDWITPVQKAETRSMTSYSTSFSISPSEEYEKREGEIIFRAGENTEHVKVYQSGSAVLILSQEEYNIGCEGAEISVDISSNFNFTTEMPMVDWIKNVTAATRAVSSHTLKFVISPNETYDKRETTITFKDVNSNKQEYIKIKQAQKNAIILLDNDIEIASEGEIFSVNVNSNIDYKFEIESGCRDWISETTISSSRRRALKETTHYFVAKENRSNQSRFGKILFTSGDITETLTIHQNAYSGNVVSCNITNIGIGSANANIKTDIGNNDGLYKTGVIYSTIYNEVTDIYGPHTTMNVFKDKNEYLSELTLLSPNTTYYYLAYIYCIEEQKYIYGTINKFVTSEAKPTVGDVIDLGLSVKWLSRNVGSTSVEEVGDLYAWGETETKSYYDKDNYKYFYEDNYIYIGEDISGTKYDVAYVKSDGRYRMPTYDEWNELTGCEKAWTSYNGRNGWVIKGPNGNMIFLPAVNKEYSEYQSSSNKNHYNSHFASYLWFTAKVFYPSYANYNQPWSMWYVPTQKFKGLPVRAVSDK